MNDNFESPVIPLKFMNRRPKFIHSDAELNNFIRSTILEWSQNDFPCPYAIQTYITQVIEPAQMKSYFTQCYNNIHSMKEHISFIQQVNSYIWALFSCRPAVTFYDIFKLIETLCTSIDRNTLGPLKKVPIIKAWIFNNADINVPPPEIRLSDIILDCANFLTERISNNNNRKLEEFVVNSSSEIQFVNYLKKKYNRNDFSLGIKITNFTALRDAAYAAKVESFHRLISSEKVTKLLRSDVKSAVKIIREKLSNTKIFQSKNDNDNSAVEKILQFSNLSFEDALGKFFKPFLDAERRISERHQLRGVSVDHDCLEAVRRLMEMLRGNELFGELFRLAAIGGALNNCRTTTTTTSQKDQPTFEEDEMIEFDMSRWRAGIFVPLMNDINRFLQLPTTTTTTTTTDSPLAPPLIDNIVTKCRAVSHLFAIESLATVHSSIDPHKSRLLANLADCARIVVKKFDKSSSIDRSLQNNNNSARKLARLNLELLPQIYYLLVSILSSGQIVKRCDKQLSKNIGLIDCVFRSKLADFIKNNSRTNQEEILFESLAELEGQILELLQLTSWPLEGSFIDYLLANQSEIVRVMQSSSQSTANPNNNEDLDQQQDQQQQQQKRCDCLAVQKEFVEQLVRQTPSSVSLEIFRSRVLPWSHGVVEWSDRSCRVVEEIWEDQQLRQQHLLADGLAPAVDIRMRSFLRSGSGSTAGDCKEVANPDAVMRAISRVGVMENVERVLKWNEIYRDCWGEVGKFMNDHSELARLYNVRLLLSEMGAMRVHAVCSDAAIDETVKHLPIDDRQVVGLIVSILIQGSSSSLQFCRLIDGLVNHVAATSDKRASFAQFANSAIDLAPPELVCEIISDVIYPMARRLAADDETEDSLLSVLEMCHESVLVLLQTNLAPNHPVTDIVRTIRARSAKQTAATTLGNVDMATIQSTTSLIAASITNQSNLHTDVRCQYVADDENDCDLVIDVSEDGVESSNKRGIVEDIRCNEFGVGLELRDAASSKLVENFNNKMARLVEHLSNDLYANASHFVLELVQNADDNLYSAHVRPKLDLVWREQTQHGDNSTAGLVLEVQNNELGFTENDLRSLCDIGASTKCENRTNKIGRKGIGFKSVFLVSDRPEIHSNGFHVRFERFRRDKDNKKVSNNALVPSWCEESDAIYNRNTTIKLPIISSLTNHIRESVAHQMKPYLLLFLRNLTKISIKSSDDSGKMEEQFIELVQQENGAHNHRVVLSHTGEKHSWFLRSKQMPVLDLEMQKINPRGLSVTELTVAIPLNDQDLEDLPAFAYLPIRSYGLRFIVNADFSIPASREDIANECAWNKWLIEQISFVFAECLVDFIAGNRGEKEEQTIRILQCIPLPGEVPTDSSFHALIPRIRSQLVNLAWLPDRYGTLHAPCQLIIESVDDSCLTQVLCNRLNLTLLHPDIAGCSLDRVIRVLNWLGCQSLSLIHLSKLLSALTPEDLVNQSLMKSIILAIHNGLERDSSLVTSNRLIVQLSSMPIWPVINSGKEQYVSIDQSTLPIFLPPSHWNSLQSADPYSRIRLVISPSFIASFQADNNKRLNVATSILQRLGVHELTSTTMINHAIVPFLMKPNPPPRQWFISVAQYLVDQCHPSQYRENVMPLLSFPTISHTCNGNSSPTMSAYSQLYRVHLSSAMESMSSSVLPLLHNHIDYVVLDDAYLDNCIFKPNQWREFFLLAGVSETFYKSPTEEFVYPEIESLLEMNDKRLNVDLLRYLDMNWIHHLSSAKYQGILSPFMSRSSLPVCASYNDLNKPDQLLDLSLPLRKPSETLFLSTNDPNKPLISDSLLIHFPICPVMFSNAALPQRIGMIDQINIDQILALMKNVFVEKTVNFTGKQSIDFYNWIRHNLSDISLRKLIGKFRSILGGAMFIAVPTDSGDENDDCDLLVSQCCYWTLPIIDGGTHKIVFLQDQQAHEDLKQLISKNGAGGGGGTNCSSGSRALVNLFPGLQELFVDICGVREFPTCREIWPALENLLKLLSCERLKELNNAEVELITDVYNVIRFLDQYDNGNHRSDILDLKVIPCFSGNYRSILDKKKSVRIFSWRSIETVHSFQQHLDQQDIACCPIDFVSLSLMKREPAAVNNYFHNNGSNSHRWSAAQFIQYYFNLPVLEDEMCFRVDNRENFTISNDVKLMLAHLEVIVSQWFQRNVPRDGVAHCINLLGSITQFCCSSEDVYVSVSLREHAEIGYRYSQNVYIGATSDESYGKNTFELLLGGLDLQLQGLEALNCVMSSLISFILEGDRFNHLRERFKKFYRSLFDLIETSDHNHVSIFIRSHNLRINPSSIDYIFGIIRPFEQEQVELERIQPEDVCRQSEPNSPLELLVDNLMEPPNSPAAKSDASSTNKSLKRKRISISVENVIPAKQICLNRENVLNDEDNLIAETQINNETLSKPPLHINNDDQVQPAAINENRISTCRTKENNDLIANQKAIPINQSSDLPTGRNSPLSLRLKEQNISQKDIRLSISKAGPENVAHVSGRIGEHLAYQKLTGTQRLGEWEVLRVDWVNQDVESRLPYDFKLSARRPDSNVPEIIYLEVKATTQPNKLQFDLSPQEVTAAWSFKEFYHLLLVYHSGSFPDTNTRFVHIPDTLGQLQDNQCKLLLDVASLLQK